MSWPTPDRLPLLAVAALLLVARVLGARLIAPCRIAIAISVLLFARLRVLTLARLAGRLVLTLIPLLLSAGTLLLIALTLVALIVCHGHLLRGDMATARRLPRRRQRNQ